MKYKSVLVYTGYAENGIENVAEFQATSLLDAVLAVEQNQLDEMLENDEELNEDWYKEFFGKGRLSSSEGVGIVNAGEENVLLVFDENNKWFGLVDSFETWTEELYEEWCKFLNEEPF